MEGKSTTPYTEFNCEAIQVNEDETTFQVIKINLDEIRNASTCNKYLKSLQTSCDLQLQRKNECQVPRLQQRAEVHINHKKTCYKF